MDGCCYDYVVEEDMEGCMYRCANIAAIGKVPSAIFEKSLRVICHARTTHALVAIDLGICWSNKNVGKARQVMKDNMEKMKDKVHLLWEKVDQLHGQLFDRMAPVEDKDKRISNLVSDMGNIAS